MAVAEAQGVILYFIYLFPLVNFLYLLWYHNWTICILQWIEKNVFLKIISLKYPFCCLFLVKITRFSISNINLLLLFFTITRTCRVDYSNKAELNLSKPLALPHFKFWDNSTAGEINYVTKYKITPCAFTVLNQRWFRIWTEA